MSVSENMLSEHHDPWWFEYLGGETVVVRDLYSRLLTNECKNYSKTSVR